MEFERFLDEITEEGKRQTAELESSEKWLKCVCAFANEEGGVLIFGVSGDGSVKGIENVKAALETVREKIKGGIEPCLQVSVRCVEAEDGKNLLLAEIPAGRETPYYYISEGSAKAYVRAKEGGIAANREEVKRLVFRGAGDSYDSLSSGYDFKEVAFTEFCSCYQEWTGRRMNEKKFEAFGMMTGEKVTNAGILFADDCPVPHSRLFCTRWKGLDKSMGRTGIMDSAEYSGNLISLLNKGVSFVKRNMENVWKSTKGSRAELSDYCDQSIFEALVNALAHRDYLARESEIHIDMFDDCLMIYSPGGMADGTRIQERKSGMLSSVRRNPVVADIFQKIGYMERKGCGLNKIRKACKGAANYNIGKAPEFYSDSGQFTVILKNMNYEGIEERMIVLTEKEKKVLTLLAEFPTISTDHVSQRSEIPKRTVERILQSLKKKGAVVREGSRRSGYWRVVEEDKS